MAPSTVEEARSAHFRAFWQLVVVCVVVAFTFLIPGDAWWNAVLLFGDLAAVVFFFVRSMQAWWNYTQTKRGS